MSRAVAFEMVPGAVQQTLEHVTTGEFDISVPLLGAAAVEATYGIRGYAELARVGVPVQLTADGLEQADFHVFGVTEGAPFLDAATVHVMESTAHQTLLPAGSIAVTDSFSLAEYGNRSDMTPERLPDYETGLLEAGPFGVDAPIFVPVHAIPGIGPKSVIVGREAVFASLLERGEASLSSRQHFSAAIGGLRHQALLHVHALNPTRITYMRRPR